MPFLAQLLASIVTRECFPKVTLQTARTASLESITMEMILAGLKNASIVTPENPPVADPLVVPTVMRGLTPLEGPRRAQLVSQEPKAMPKGQPPAQAVFQEDTSLPRQPKLVMPVIWASIRTLPGRTSARVAQEAIMPIVRLRLRVTSALEVQLLLRLASLLAMIALQEGIRRMAIPRAHLARVANTRIRTDRTHVSFVLKENSASPTPLPGRTNALGAVPESTPLCKDQRPATIVRQERRVRRQALRRLA